MASRPSRPATFYVVKGSSDVRWRCELPARHLKAKLVTMRESEGGKLLTAPNDGKKFPWHLTDEAAAYPAHEGTAVWVRPDQVRALHALAMHSQGVRTLAEVDDNYLSDPTQNIFMRMHEYDAVGRNNHMRAFATFDGWVVSTKKLGEIYAKAFRKELGKKSVPPIFVCRNHVDPDDWRGRIPMLPPGDGRVRVGWVGSHQHLWDLRLAAPALRLAYDMGCEVVFVGLDPASWDPKWREFLPNYTHVPWFTKYHKYSINIDVGLIPLVQNGHTDGKSDVKFLEYAMSGAASVVQSSPIYNGTVIHNETGLLASGPDDMAFKMRDLILQKPLRKRLAESAKQYVLENRTMQGNIHEWKDAING